MLRRRLRREPGTQDPGGPVGAGQIADRSTCADGHTGAYGLSGNRRTASTRVSPTAVAKRVGQRPAAPPLPRSPRCAHPAGRPTNGLGTSTSTSTCADSAGRGGAAGAHAGRATARRRRPVHAPSCADTGCTKLHDPCADGASPTPRAAGNGMPVPPSLAASAAAITLLQPPGQQRSSSTGTTGVTLAYVNRQQLVWSGFRHNPSLLCV